jgi:hypothetical protein
MAVAEGLDHQDIGAALPVRVARLRAGLLTGVHLRRGATVVVATAAGEGFAKVAVVVAAGM